MTRLHHAGRGQRARMKQNPTSSKISQKIRASRKAARTDFLNVLPNPRDLAKKWKINHRKFQWTYWLSTRTKDEKRRKGSSASSLHPAAFLFLSVFWARNEWSIVSHRYSIQTDRKKVPIRPNLLIAKPLKLKSLNFWFFDFFVCTYSIASGTMCITQPRK